jgi:hypothetical protein
MRATALASAVSLITLLFPTASVLASQLSAACPYRSGFADLKAQIGARMGNPSSCEYPDPKGTGDTEQTTTSGLAFWRKSTNTPTFTNGFDHWALTSNGLLYWTGDSVDPPVVTAAVPTGLTPTEAAAVDAIVGQANLSFAISLMFLYSDWDFGKEANLLADRNAALQDFTQGYLSPSQTAEKFDGLARRPSSAAILNSWHQASTVSADVLPDMNAVLLVLGHYLDIEARADAGYAAYLREFQQAGRRVSPTAQLLWDRAQRAAVDGTAIRATLDRQWREIVCAKYGLSNFSPETVGCA